MDLTNTLLAAEIAHCAIATFNLLPVEPAWRGLAIGKDLSEDWSCGEEWEKQEREEAVTHGRMKGLDESVIGKDAKAELPATGRSDLGQWVGMPTPILAAATGFCPPPNG